VSSVEGESWSQPSRRFWKMRITELTLLGLIALALSVAAAGRHPVARIVSSLVVVGAFAGAFAVLRGRYRSWGYCERAEDLLVRRGVMIRRLSVVPYGRMQFVEVTAGLVERIFKLSTVKLHTAAARSDARIPGLDPAEAARLRDRLAALGEAKAAGL
jgi:uncharacterized protein